MSKEGGPDAAVLEQPGVGEDAGSEDVAGQVGKTMETLGTLDREFELKELRTKQEEFTTRIARIEARIKKVCPDEMAATPA